MTTAATTPSVNGTAAAGGSSFDAIVVGAGHNGLVAATYLARAGLKVRVYERRAGFGGATLQEELWLVNADGSNPATSSVPLGASSEAMI